MAASLSVSDLREKLGALGLDTRGHRSELQARLRKKGYKRQQQERANLPAGSTPRDARNARPTPGPWRPAYHSYLVLDVEATCEDGTQYPATSRKRGFDYPNEIIEFPVILLQWRRCNNNSTASNDAQDAAQIDTAGANEDERYELYEKDVFHTLVRPTWRPRLSRFCRSLTSVRQASVDAAPTFCDMLVLLYQFLHRHDLIEEKVYTAPRGAHANGRRGNSVGSATTRLEDANGLKSARLKKGVCWVTHGPFDLLHFVVKQAYISQIEGGVPVFLRGPLLDVKIAAVKLVPAASVASEPVTSDKASTKVDEAPGNDSTTEPANGTSDRQAKMVRKSGRDTTIVGLLHLLDLGEFQGQEHVGIDDTRNVARIMVEMARRVATSRPDTSEEGDIDTIAAHRKQLESMALLPNTNTNTSHLRRWAWMSSKQPGDVDWDLAAEVSEDEKDNAEI